VPFAGGAGRQGRCRRRDRVPRHWRRCRRQRSREGGRRGAGDDGRRGPGLRLQPVRHHRHQPREPGSPLPRRQPQVSCSDHCTRCGPSGWSKPRKAYTADLLFWKTSSQLVQPDAACVLRSTVPAACVVRSPRLSWQVQPRQSAEIASPLTQAPVCASAAQEEAAAEGVGGGGTAAGAARRAIHGAAPRPRGLPRQRPAAAGRAAPAVVRCLPLAPCLSPCQPAGHWAALRLLTSRPTL